MTSPSAALLAPADSAVDLAEVVEALSASFTVVTGGSQVVRRARLDTFDHRLRDAGLVLEHHATATDGRLVLVGPDAVATRTEPVTDPRWPALSDALPAGSVRDALAPVTGIRALMVTSEERRRVRRVELHDPEGKTVARLQLDEPVGKTSAVPAEVRVLPLRGYDEAARRTSTILAALGLRPATDDADLDHVPPPAGPDRSAPATVLLAGVLQEFLAAMQANLPGLLDDVDTEFLHDFRVAIRRTRSTLKLGRPALPEEMRTRWEPAFKWLGDLTTPVRDLDVYELDLPAMSGWLVAAEPSDLGPFAAHLRRRRTAERRALVRGLRSARFTRLLADWEQALNELAAAEHTDGDHVDEDAGSGAPTAGELADRSITRTFRRVARDGGSITPDSPAEDLHSLRKRCKELRYALEVFSGVIDKTARKQAVTDLKGLQDVLGRFQDSEVQRHALREFAEEMVADGTSAGAVLAMGELVGHLDGEQDRAHQDFRSTFGRFVRPSSTARLQRLGGRG